MICPTCKQNINDPPPFVAEALSNQHDQALQVAKTIMADYSLDANLPSSISRRGNTNEFILACEVVWLREFRSDAAKKIYNICRALEEPDGPRAYTTEERELFIGENERLAKENTSLERRLRTELPPAGMVMVRVKNLLAVRDHLVIENADVNEAYYQLYTCVDWQNSHKPWAEWEAILSARERKA